MKIKLAILTAITCASTFAASPDPMQAFPAPEAGFVRKVIQLPKVKNPELYRVQLLPGKMMEVDCNTRNLGGQLKKETAQGWGYDYWVLPQIQPGISTLMACNPNAPKKQAFVSVYSEELHRYNYKLPMVVYLPEGLELRYRIWSAKDKTQTAENG
ncbi:serine protease inhibitor ecotin [Iodobacter sp. CM08]|uniref:serine protease inhibitor ecotin n=1 Tax=Iodobacter sp. CM08 TaxID=3085902 RepID=UPI0029826221|nr:serine protease inhibitor ecotin [Iodobacter sp. CM08]MDW5416945.1 serine protease inhibitor ecotin [Iodobacter sp. CM08]